jgi:chromosome segregation ATPase
LGAAEKGQRKRQSIGAAEQDKDKATELAQSQSNAENPTVLRKELQQKDRVMENLIQSHDELQAKLKQVSDQLAEEQRGGQERMRVAKEAQKNVQGQIQSLNTDLGKAHDRAKDKARELGDAQKQLSSNRGLLRQRDTEVKNLKERLKAAEQLQSGNLGKGAKDADVAAAHERELEEIKKLLEEKEAMIKSLLGKQDQRAREVADLQKERDGLLRKVNSESDKARQAIETKKQAAEAEVAKRQKTELKLWNVKQQLNKLRDQDKGWTNETVGLQKKLEDAENAAAKEAKGRVDVEEDLKERLRACEKLVDELQDRVKEAEKNGVDAAAGESGGAEKERGRAQGAGGAEMVPENG